MAEWDAFSMSQVVATMATMAAMATMATSGPKGVSQGNWGMLKGKDPLGSGTVSFRVLRSPFHWEHL